jgi:hypothetical protein
MVITNRCTTCVLGRRPGHAPEAENMRCRPADRCLTIQPMNERALAASVPGGALIGVRSGQGRPLLVLHGGPAVNDYSDWPCNWPRGHPAG